MGERMEAVSNVVNGYLAEAIRLRILVHRALDLEDWPAVADANRAADAAYLRLSPRQASQYMEWARDHIPSPSELIVPGWDA